MIFDGLDSLEKREGKNPLQRRALQTLFARLNYSEYGGAPLLGVNGIVLIGHGRSDAKAIANAVRWAREIRRCRVNESIVAAVEGVTEG